MAQSRIAFLLHLTGASGGGATALTYLTVTADNSGGSAKSNWPVKVSLTSGNFTFANVNASGTNIDFRATDGVTPLSYWRQDFDNVGQTATFWVKFPTVGAGATATARLYYGAGIGDLSNGVNTFPTLFEDFDTALATDYTHSQQIGNVDRYANPIFAPVTNTWKDSQWERGRVVYNAAETDPNRLYKCYTAGRDATNVGRIGVLFSPDSITWTEYGSNPIIVSSPTVGNGIEDPYTIMVSGTYHLYTESTSGADAAVQHWTSTDGVAFSLVGIAVPHGGAGAWDEVKTGTPVVWIESGTWYMVYDGRDALDNQQVGSAHSADGITWIKNANNPIITAASGTVPSECIKIGSTYYLHAKDAGSVVDIYTTTVAPLSWDNTSFVNTYNDASYTGDTTFADNSNNSRVTMEQKTAGLWMGDVVGSSIWTAERPAAAANNKSPRFSKIEAHSGTLVFSPNDAVGVFSSLLRTTTLALTNDFAIGFRMKKIARNSDQLYARVGFGTGSIVAASGNGYWYTYNDGYGVLLGREGTSTSSLWETTAGTSAVLGSNFSIASFSAYALYELRYRSTGALSLIRNGSSLQSTTDSTNLNTSKNICITQGQNSQLGAISTYDWFYVRPYDGVDPSIVLS